MLEASGTLLKLDASTRRTARHASPSARTRGTSPSTAPAPRSTSRGSSRRRSPARRRRSSEPKSAASRSAVKCCVVNAASHDRARYDRICSTATSPTPRTKAAAYRTTSAHVAISPGRQQRCRTVQARQHRARHAAQRRESEFPEHGARDQPRVIDLDGERRGLLAAHRSRQRRASRARRSTIASASICSSRSRRAARSRSSMPMRSHELFRFNVGRAPQGLVISPDG